MPGPIQTRSSNVFGAEIMKTFKLLKKKKKNHNHSLKSETGYVTYENKAQNIQSVSSCENRVENKDAPNNFLQANADFFKAIWGEEQY